MPAKNKTANTREDFILLPYGTISLIGASHPVHYGTWEALWPDGKVGYSDTRHTMPKGRKAELQESTQKAMAFLDLQRAELVRGLARLETMEEKDYEALAAVQAKSEHPAQPAAGPSSKRRNRAS